MATNDNGHEQVSLQERMLEVDKITESPSKRAQKVWEYAKLVSDKTGFTTWDLLCFATEWLGIMTPVWPWLEEPARSLAKRVYYAHYYLTDVVLGEERRAQEPRDNEELSDADNRTIELDNDSKHEARTEIDL